MYFMSDPQALHVTRNVIPGKLGVDLHLHRVHIPLISFYFDYHRHRLRRTASPMFYFCAGFTDAGNRFSEVVWNKNYRQCKLTVVHNSALSCPVIFSGYAAKDRLCGNVIRKFICVWFVIFTLRAKLSGVVYCNRSCLCVRLFVCLFVCGSVTTITRNCVHQSSPNWVCR